MYASPEMENEMQSSKSHEDDILVQPEASTHHEAHVARNEHPDIYLGG